MHPGSSVEPGAAGHPAPTDSLFCLLLASPEDALKQAPFFKQALWGSIAAARPRADLDRRPLVLRTCGA